MGCRLLGRRRQRPRDALPERCLRAAPQQLIVAGNPRVTDRIRRGHLRLPLALGLLAGLSCTAAEEERYAPEGVTRAAYDQAASLLSSNVQGAVRNAEVVPNWIGERDEFWYERDTDQGTEIVIVDAATGERRPAVDPEALPGFATDPLQLLAPDGSVAAFARDHDVWLQDLPDGSERRLSHDGEEHFGYGSLPGWSGKLALLRAGLEGPLTGAYWSPDATKLLIARTDERRVGAYPWMDLLPADGTVRPRTLEKRIALIGDREVPRFPMYLFDVASGASRSVPLPEDCFGELGATPPQAIWTDDSRLVFFLCLAPDASRFELVRYDLATGSATTVFEEEADSFLDLNHSLYRSMGANVRLLASGRRAITFSQRDGWGHLYLVDLEGGGDIRQLTQGEWVVHDIVAVDEREGGGFVYFTAGGREPGRNPYWRHVYRVPLEGDAEVELLTRGPADHAVTVAAPALIGAASTFSPSGRYFVSNSSTVDSPPVSRLHRSDGSVVTILEQADASELFARGYEPPQPFTVKATDGETDLYGVLWRPKNFEEGRKYPVIEHIYGGPQTNVVPRNFNSAAGVERIGGQGDFSTSTALGFAVVTIDARGTPWRSKEFHDYMWKKHDEFALEDHVAALEQLGERFPWLDMDRVGISGHSWGGYSSALAMLRYPEFYKVAVSSGAPYDYRYLYPPFVKWTGWPEYDDGGRLAPDAAARPVNLMPHSALASQLEGKMLIVYGEHDENSLPASTLTLIDALIEADRDFDLLVLPNRDHFFTQEPYFIRRRWDYFVRHLMGAE
ncbi:MAG: prolyl oligopeptidase family serine peptidase, partial [Gemmatimonadetes bacterium]|nr:prolyl oligopeptidase family serine peptidase [Gemmatimonadota bacterium]